MHAHVTLQTYKRHFFSMSARRHRQGGRGSATPPGNVKCGKFSVRPSVTLRYDDRTGWNTSKITSWLISPRLFSVCGLQRRDQHKILTGIGNTMSCMSNSYLHLLLALSTLLCASGRKIPITTISHCWATDVQFNVGNINSTLFISPIPYTSPNNLETMSRIH